MFISFIPILFLFSVHSIYRIIQSVSCQPFFVRRRCEQYLINSAGGSWGREIFLLLSYCSRFFFLKVDLLWQMTSYRNVLKSRWEEAKKSEIWSRQLMLTLIDNCTCGECILNKILNWMRKNVKHFVPTILQFYYSFNFKLPTLISELPRSVLKRFRWCLKELPG